MLTDEKTGLKYREGTYDLAIIREMERSYGSLHVCGRRVLDIGACIGSFVHWCMGHAAASVAAFEPDLDNFALLLQNTSSYTDKNVHVYPYAVMRDSAQNVLFWKASGMNKGLGSPVEHRGRECVMVESMAFKSIVDALLPQVVKIDIEGGEYGLFNKLPRSVTQVAMELHLNRAEWREREAPAIVDFFADWDCVKTPKIGEKNWATVGVWRR